MLGIYAGTVWLGILTVQILYLVGGCVYSCDGDDEGCCAIAATLCGCAAGWLTWISIIAVTIYGYMIRSSSASKICVAAVMQGADEYLLVLLILNAIIIVGMAIHVGY